MAKAAGKMICPRCGAEMNHHCDKLMPGAGLRETRDPGEREPLWREIIAEFHACPKCGAAVCRNAEGSSLQDC